MHFRVYNPEKDKKDAFRIWLECGWVEDEEKDKRAFDQFTTNNRCEVVDLDGSPECLVVTSPAKMQYGARELNLTAVAAVTVSRLLRKQGAAPRLMASMLEKEIAAGADVAGLGMFEQGFYNRLGFATMGYETWYSFDPAQLKLYKKGGIPVRVSLEDWKEVHRSVAERRKGHGFVTLSHPEQIHAEMLWHKNGFGLGFKKGGRLGHHVWFSTKDPEEGPYMVLWMAYQTWEEFLELMGIIKSLEEQVRLVEMKEPAGIQLQDFIDKPFRHLTVTRRGAFESRVRSIAYQQLRICNLPSCIGAVEYEGPPFSFNLTLPEDPLRRYLPEESSFRGCSGKFTVTIGSRSGVKDGHQRGLPEIKGSINGFSRLWIGVLPASTIGLTEDLQIPDSLMAPLERAFFSPQVRTDWDY